MGQVGVDIGTTAVRVVEVDGVDEHGKARVVAAATEPVADEAVDGGLVRAPAATAEALRAAFKRARASRRGVVVTVTDPDATLQQVHVPAKIKRPADRDRAAVNEAGVPGGASRPVTAVSPTGEQVGESQVLAVATATRTALSSLRSALDLAKVEPAAVDLHAAALLRAYLRPSPERRDTILVADIGARQTTCALSDGGVLRAVATRSTGGDHVTHRLMANAGLSRDQAEETKRRLRVGNREAGAARTLLTASYVDDEAEDANTEGATLIDNAVNDAADDIVRDIVEVVEAESSRPGRRAPAGVLLAGSGALLRGLQSLVARRTALPAQVVQPFARLEETRGTQSVRPSEEDLKGFGAGAAAEQRMIELAPAVGAALWSPQGGK